MLYTVYQSPTEIRTRVSGFKVQCVNHHYTMGLSYKLVYVALEMEQAAKLAAKTSEAYFASFSISGATHIHTVLC